jgi:hypothetical protein
MSLRNTTPIAWRPRGLTDAIDSSTSIHGSMANLQNLIPDPTTAGVWQCRPAAVLLCDFNLAGGGPFSPGFSSGFQTGFFPSVGSAGPISCLLVSGDRCFGMVGGPGGFDYPFMFDLITKMLVFVTGYNDTTKLPLTQPQTGAWVPPTLDLVGTNVLVTHPGFLGGGTNNYFGWFDIGNPAAPTWSAGNLTGAIQFLFPPTAVRGFNGRAYWLSNPPTGNPAAIFSDILLPRNITNATQVITFDDNTRLTALAPLPLNNQLGGIIQALMVFKGSAQTYQITGDAASTQSPLAKNALNIATGTDSSASLAVSTKGIAFAAPDGLRIIDFNAQVTDPIGWDGHGKVLPFIFSGTPSRVVGAATGTTYRLSIQDNTIIGAPFVDYWFDVVRGIWSGPHTFPANAIDAYKSAFVMSARGVNGKLWQADSQQNSSSTFIENGTQLQWKYTTSLLPDQDQMEESSMIETTLYLAMQSNVTYPIQALGSDGSIISQAQILLQGIQPLWGTAIWGGFVWGGVQGSLFPRPVPWPAPVVFRRMALSVNGPSDANVKLGAWHCRYERLGYLQQSLVA